MITKNTFVRYKRDFRQSVYRHKKVHVALHTCIEDVSTTCRKSINNLNDIQVRLSLAKEIDDSEQLVQISAIWEDCHRLVEAFQSLLEQHDNMEQCITDCLVNIEKAKNNFQYSKKFDKIAYNTMMFTWFTLVGMKAYPHNMTRHKISMLAIGGAVLGTSFMGLIVKCTSYEENGIDIVWLKIKRDLDKLQRKRIEIRAIVEITKWDVDAYEQLAFKNIGYSLKPDLNIDGDENSSASENEQGQINAEKTDNHHSVRMNIQIDKMLAMTSLLQGFLLETQRNAEQNAFDIEDLFYIKNPIDLIDFL
jgi:hypothetical protein